MTAVKLQDDVGRRLIRSCPTIFLNGHVLSFAVESVETITAARHQAHAFLIETLAGNVAIMNGEGLPLLPVAVLAETLTHRTNSQGMNLAVGIFPALLQQTCDLSHVLSSNLLAPAEACLTDAFAAWRFEFVIELHCLWLLGEGNAHTHLAHRIARASDGFNDTAQEKASGGKGADIDHTDSFAVDKVSIEFGTLSAFMRIGIDADIGLDNSRHFGIDVAAPPRRTALIGVGSGAVEDESSPQASSANESAAVIGAATIPVKIFAFFI